MGMNNLQKELQNLLDNPISVNGEEPLLNDPFEVYYADLILESAKGWTDAQCDVIADYITKLPERAKHPAGLYRSLHNQEIAPVLPTDNKEVNKAVEQAKIIRESHVKEGSAPFFSTYEACQDFYDKVIPHFDGTLPNDFKERVEELLSTLTPREEKVFTAELGLKDSSPKSKAEVADNLGISVDRLKQIEAKGLRKARNREEKGITDLMDNGNMNQDVFAVRMNEGCVEYNGDGSVTVSVPQFEQNGGEVPFAKVKVSEQNIIDEGDGTVTIALIEKGSSEILEANHPTIEGEARMDNDDIFAHFSGFNPEIKPDFAREDCDTVLHDNKEKADKISEKAPIKKNNLKGINRHIDIRGLMLCQI